MKILEACSNYLNYLKNAKSSSVNTLRAYHEDLRQFLTISKEFFIDPLNFRPMSQDWELDFEGLQILLRASLDTWKDLSTASRNRKIATLKSFDRYLQEHNLLVRPFTAHIPTPKRKVIIPHFISADECVAVLKLLKKDMVEQTTARGGTALHRFILFAVIYGGGLRVSEACGLKWADYEADHRRWRLKGKGSVWRVIPLPLPVSEELERLDKSTPFLFGDKPLDPRVAYQWIREAGAAAGLLKRLHPHALRHSYATHLLNSGASLRILQDLLGHSNLSTTQKYLHLNLDQLSSTMQNCHPLSRLKLKAS